MRRETAQTINKKRPKGPLPLSRNGKLPGIGIAPMARNNRFSMWLKIKRVRSTHEGKPIDQRKLAEISGISHPVISKIEQGRMRPKAEYIPILGRIFGEDTDRLYPMIYMLPTDMYFFLVCTEEGERVMQNIRKIMDTIENKGKGFTTKPYVNESDYERTYHYNKTRRFDEFMNMDEEFQETALANSMTEEP